MVPQPRIIQRNRSFEDLGIVLFGNLFLHVESATCWQGDSNRSIRNFCWQTQRKWNRPSMALVFSDPLIH